MRVLRFKGDLSGFRPEELAAKLKMLFPTFQQYSYSYTENILTVVLEEDKPIEAVLKALNKICPVESIGEE